MNQSPPSRSDILLDLWRDHDRLEQLRSDIHNDKKYVAPKWKFEVWVIQVKAQLSHEALDVLREKDLDQLTRDVEEIKKVIENRSQFG